MSSGDNKFYKTPKPKVTKRRALWEDQVDCCGYFALDLYCLLPPKTDPHQALLPLLTCQRLRVWNIDPSGSGPLIQRPSGAARGGSLGVLIQSITGTCPRLFLGFGSSVVVGGVDLYVWYVGIRFSFSLSRCLETIISILSCEFWSVLLS